MNLIQNTEVNQNEPDNDSALTVDMQGIDHWGIPDRKTRKQWYHSTNPQIRSYITGNLSASISGKGARSLKRAFDEYQYLSEDLARHSYSPKAMSEKWDNFNGIDSSILDKALKNEHTQLDTHQQQFNEGQLNERKFNRLQQKHERRINNLNENYQTLSEVWHNKHGIPLVRTQSSVSSLPFLLGTIGLPVATIGLISGGAAAAPYIGKALANPWVQRGLTGLDVVDTGVQAASGNYLGAAANWIPYDKVHKFFKYLKYAPHNVSEGVKNLYNRYTAPRTTIKHTPYKGDQHQLAKFRLVNGGFDKLGIHAEDAMFLPKEHPVVKAGYGYDSAKWENDTPVKARTFLLKSEAVPLRSKEDVLAWYDQVDKIYYQPSYGKDSKLNMDTKVITAHEFQHAVDDVRIRKNMPTFEQSQSPSITPPGTDMSKVPWYVQDYFQLEDGTELHARLAQLKNWYGIKDPNQPITLEMWNHARRHYVPSMGGFDNNMQQMFRAVTDPKKFLDWINPRVAVQAGAVGTVGLSTLKTDEKK